MDDSELVHTAQSGDPNAWAAIYDRYTDRIHDFAYATLRDRAGAAEVVEQTFAIGYERLEQLREPGRLGPWLFAIAHHATLTRSNGRDRPPGAGAGPAATAPATQPAAEHPSRDELAEFVWQAAGDLGAWDRALLDLHLRQELDGIDLSDAAGVTRSQMTNTLNRLLSQVERSLGALLVARSNRRSCPRLAEILAGWDGLLTPEVRDQITGHVDDCETCNSRRRLVLNPLGLLAGVALVPAPASLRRTVLSGGRRGAEAGWVFNADGFPYQGGDRQVEAPATGPVPAARRAESYTPTTAYSRVNTYRSSPTAVTPVAPRPAPPWHKPDRRGVVIGGLAGVIVLIGGILILVATPGHRAPGSVAVSVPTTAVPDTTTPPTTRPAPTTTRPPGPTTVPPGHFVVGAKGLEFGTTGVSQSVMVGNDGAGPLAFTAVAPNAALSIVPASGSIEPGANTTLTVTLNRANAPPGPLSTTVSISSGSGAAIISVTAIVDPGPSIKNEQVMPTSLIVNACPSTSSGSTLGTVTAQVTAPIPLTADGVQLHSRPMMSGFDAPRQMTVRDTSASAGLGPFGTPDTVEWWITATDTQGAGATTVHHMISVTVCPR